MFILQGTSILAYWIIALKTSEELFKLNLSKQLYSNSKKTY